MRLSVLVSCLLRLSSCVNSALAVKLWKLFVLISLVPNKNIQSVSEGTICIPRPKETTSREVCKWQLSWDMCWTAAGEVALWQNIRTVHNGLLYNPALLKRSTASASHINQQ